MHLRDYYHFGVIKIDATLVSEVMKVNKQLDSSTSVGAHRSLNYKANLFRLEVFMN